MTPKERARGLMAGIAVGSLLGIRTEGWLKHGVAQSFSDGVRDITAHPGYPDGHGWKSSQIGCWTLHEQ